MYRTAKKTADTWREELQNSSNVKKWQERRAILEHLEGPTDMVTSCLFPSPNVLLASSGDSKVYCYDTETRTRTQTLSPGSKWKVWTLRHDGGVVAAAHGGATTFDLETGGVLWQSRTLGCTLGLRRLLVLCCAWVLLPALPVPRCLSVSLLLCLRFYVSLTDSLILMIVHIVFSRSAHISLTFCSPSAHRQLGRSWL